MLTLRCSQHPEYTGAFVPEHQACPDCWELYRRTQERG